MQPIVFIQAQAGSTLYVGDPFTGDLVEAEPVKVTQNFADASRSGDPNPITSDQRRALFAAFSEAFGRDVERHDRHLFTTAVLGHGVNPSWASPDAGGELTYNQAARLLTVLTVINHLL